MTIDDKNIIWLNLFDFLSYGKKFKILSLVKGENLRTNFLNNRQIKEILTSQEFNKMSLCLSDEFLNRNIAEYEKANIQIVTFYNSNYPYILKEIATPPLCLYCKGNIELLNTFCFGVVGTRKPTDYGIQVTKQYCKQLADAGVTIVSGMATGIDSIAHKTALENQGKTIAVLAGGFNHIYPQTNYALANKLMEGNLLISEYPPDTLPQYYYFPVRNRIIAGLSKGVLVPEMGEKSGSMHTINYALEFNRDIFVVPGKINSPMSKGSNALIKNLQGCITTSPEDIIECYHLKKNNEVNLTKQLDITAQMILNFVQTEKKSFQEILDHTKLNANELNTLLITLEIEGLIIKLANNSYIMS